MHLHLQIPSFSLKSDQETPYASLFRLVAFFSFVVIVVVVVCFFYKSKFSDSSEKLSSHILQESSVLRFSSGMLSSQILEDYVVSIQVLLMLLLFFFGGGVWRNTSGIFFSSSRLHSPKFTILINQLWMQFFVIKWKWLACYLNGKGGSS